jgi:excinuclease ABC subunit A
VLELTCPSGRRFFAAKRDVRALKPLATWAGVPAAGQPVPTLPGGEAQRLKLAGHLAETQAAAARDRRAAVLVRRADDGPALRRHREAAASLPKLIAAGHSLIVIEHNLDVIRASDWVIDLGPEGGDAAGEVVSRARRRADAACGSHTGSASRYEDALPRRPARAARLLASSEPLAKRARDRISHPQRRASTT